MVANCLIDVGVVFLLGDLRVELSRLIPPGLPECFQNAELLKLSNVLLISMIIWWRLVLFLEIPTVSF